MITDSVDVKAIPARAARSLRRSRTWVAAVVWLLVPFAGALLVLVASYFGVTHRRYGATNGTSGEILPGHSVGQSFVSRYANLSGVELFLGTYGRGSEPSAASLVLHVRAAPTDPSCRSCPDLATARLPAGTVLGENPWYLFTFPPIAGSQDRALYFEVESPDASPGRALTLFWWQPVTVGNPYAYGTAYRDGTATRGDLGFGLRYSPPPYEAWAQVGRAATALLPPGTLWVLLVPLLLLCFAAALWAALRLPALLRDPEESRNWLLRRSLPLALSVAALNGLLYALLVPPWQAPDEPSHFAYVALLDKHGLDDTYVKSLDLNGSDRDDALIAAVNSSMERADYTRRIDGYSHPGSPVDAGQVLFQQVRQPPAYYLLSAVALRAARAVDGGADPYSNPEGALWIIRSVSVLLSLGIVALGWVAGALLSGGHTGAPLGQRSRIPFRDGSGVGFPLGTGVLRLLLPMTIALLPMHAFTVSMANNDVLAELAVSALFVTLLGLLRRPYGTRGFALAGLAVLLAWGSAHTKSTAVAAALPLVGLGLIVWVGMLATRALERSGFRPAGRDPRVVVPVALGALLFLVGCIVALLAYEPVERAAGWYLRYAPLEYAPRVRTPAHEGAYVIEVGRSPERVAASQVLVPQAVVHPEIDLTFSGWVRLPPELSAETRAARKASILVKEGSREAGLGEVALSVPGEWVPISTTGRLFSNAEQVTLWITADWAGGTVQFDNLVLQARPWGRDWQDPVFKPRLVNGSGENSSLALRPWAAAMLPFEARQIAQVLVNPMPFDRWALWRVYADGQYRTFWGNFGLFSVPLPQILYLILGIVTALALTILGWRAWRRAGAWSAREWLGAISLTALPAAVLIGFARQTMLTVVTGIPAHPQGRYLYVLAIPIVWLLLAGLSHFGFWILDFGLGRASALSSRRPASASAGANPTQWRSFNPKSGYPLGDGVPSGPPKSLGAWGPWLWLNGLALFAGYCFLALLLPFYYG